MGDFGADVSISYNSRESYLIIFWTFCTLKQREFISEEVQKAIDDVTITIITYHRKKCSMKCFMYELFYKSIRQVFGFKEEPSAVTVTYNKDKVNVWT